MSNKTKLIIALSIGIFVVRGYILFDILTKSNTENIETTTTTGDQNIQAQTGTNKNNFLDENSTGNIADELNKPVTQLDFTMPSWMVTPGLNELAIKFESNDNTKIVFNTATGVNEYYAMVESGFINNTIDMALIGTDKLVSYQNLGYTLSTKEDLSGYFHNSFSRFFAAGQAKVIPYAIDPLVIIINNQKNNKLTLNTIFDFFSLRSQGEFLFGYDVPSLSLLKTGQEPYPGYFLSIYYLVNDRYSTNNINHFKRFIDLQTKTDRSLINIRREIAKLQSTNPLCESFSHICLLANQKTVASPGFLSDLIIRDKLFSKSISTTDSASIVSFPVSQAPQRGRVWVINKNSELNEINTTLTFLASYLKSGNEGNARLVPNKMISAFNSVLDLQLTLPLYKDIKKGRDTRNLIYGSQDRQKLYTTKTQINEVLQGGINLELYFSDPGRTY